MADKLKALSILGLGYLVAKQCQGDKNYRKEAVPKYRTYNSGVYEITFEYPESWRKNPNYRERYEGETGFFEVADIEALGRDIDEVVRQEIESPINPYGTEPRVEAFEIDGEPARLIIPSSDQAKVFEREAALIIQNKKPVIEGQEVYNYTIIWSDLKNIEHIIKTLKFTD